VFARLESLTFPHKRADAIRELFGNTSSALVLARALSDGRLTGDERGGVIKAAVNVTAAQIRDLFERFLPDEQRLVRLWTGIHPQQVLSLKGDAERGRALLCKSTALQCVNCHRINGAGRTLGPDLSKIGEKYTRGQIVESVLEPSKF